MFFSRVDDASVPVGERFYALAGFPDSLLLHERLSHMTWLDWYNSLNKPNWTPAPGTIGRIWQVLYPIIVVSFGYVFVQAFRGKISWWVAFPFAINLVTNLIFTPIQFGMRNLPLAAVDILVVWLSLIWCIVAIWRQVSSCRTDRPNSKGSISRSKFTVAHPCFVELGDE